MNSIWLKKLLLPIAFGIECINTWCGGFREFGGMYPCTSIQRKIGKKRKKTKKTKKKSGKIWGRKKVEKDRRKERKKNN